MSSASPRMSRYTRQTDLDMDRPTPRVGLSDYTSQRLAELRARRAAQEDDDYKPPAALSPRRTGVQDSDSSKSTGSNLSSSSRRTALDSDYKSGLQDSDSAKSASATGSSLSSRRTALDTDYKSGLSSRRDLTKDYSSVNSSVSSSVTSPSRSSVSSIKTAQLNDSSNSSLDSGIGSRTSLSSSTRQRSTRSEALRPESSPTDTVSQGSLDTQSSSHSATPTANSTVTNNHSSSSYNRSPTSDTKTTLLNSSSTQSSNVDSHSSLGGATSSSTNYTGVSTTIGGPTLNQQLENYRARHTPVEHNLRPTYSSSTSESDMSSSIASRTNLPVVTPDLTKQCKEYQADYSIHSGHGTSVGRSNSKTAADMDDEDSVGFSSLPEQVHRKALKRGFDFTLMVVGETGLGKSTLIQSLFLNTDLYNDRQVLDVQDKLCKTVTIEKKYMEIEERGVKLRLTIVDTPGFNDSLCGEDSWKPVETYIDDQFEQYLKDESGLNRKNIKDNRVHCCLYFVSPFGHGLKPLDIHFMKRLHFKVNIVPVIAKADTLTLTEIRKLKAKILEQIDNNDINIYEFPDCDSDEDEEFIKQDTELKAAIPFAVIGSNTIVEVAGKKIRGRLYPWGIVEVDNPEHCDFTKLRQMLISTHMQDLKDVTRDCHYETYRAKHISEQMNKQAQKERKPGEVDQNSNLKPLLRPERSSKLKRDSSPNFEAIMATDQLLQQKDAQIKKMQEMLVNMQKQLHSSSPSKSSKAKVNGLGNL